MNVCPRCGQPYRVNAGHCTRLGRDGCCSSFRTQHDFDDHRTGRFGDGTRRCLTSEERLERGWEFRDGLWTSPQSLRDAQKAFARMGLGSSSHGNPKPLHGCQPDM